MDPERGKFPLEVGVTLNMASGVFTYLYSEW